MAWKVDKLYGPGAAEAEAAAKAAKIKARHEAAKRMLLETVCCECGKFGAYGDGQFLYCEDHAGYDRVNLAETRRKQQEAARAAKS